MKTPHLKLEMPGIPVDKEEKLAGGNLFKSARHWPRVGLSMSTERPQGLRLWHKQLMMSLLQLFF